MIAVKAHFDGKVIVPDEPLLLKANQRLHIEIQTIEPVESTSVSRRQLGMASGVLLYIAPDFDAELSDDFWLGEHQ